MQQNETRRDFSSISLRHSYVNSGVRPFGMSQHIHLSTLLSAGLGGSAFLKTSEDNVTGWWRMQRNDECICRWTENQSIWTVYTIYGGTWKSRHKPVKTRLPGWEKVLQTDQIRLIFSWTGLNWNKLTVMNGNELSMNWTVFNWSHIYTFCFLRRVPLGLLLSRIGAIWKSWIESNWIQIFSF